MLTTETATTMAEVDAPRSPARRRHRPLLPLPLPPWRCTRRDGGRVGVYRRRRSGDDVPPLLRIVVVPAMMPPPLIRWSSTRHVVVPTAAGSGIVRYGRIASFAVAIVVVVARHHRPHPPRQDEVHECK